jgi:hypothetical protein
LLWQTTNCPRQLLQTAQISDERVHVVFRQRELSGFRVALVFVVIPLASVIHDRISSAESLLPTLSSAPFALPLPAIEWQSEHFWSVSRRRFEPSEVRQSVP